MDAKEVAGAGGEGWAGLNEAATTAVQHFLSSDAAAAPQSHLSVCCPVFIFPLSLSLFNKVFASSAE